MLRNIVVTFAYIFSHKVLFEILFMLLPATFIVNFGLNQNDGFWCVAVVYELT